MIDDLFLAILAMDAYNRTGDDATPNYELRNYGDTLSIAAFNSPNSDIVLDGAVRRELRGANPPCEDGFR